MFQSTMITTAAILFPLLLLTNNTNQIQVVDCFSIKKLTTFQLKSKQLSSFNLLKLSKEETSNHINNNSNKSTILNRRDILFKIPSLSILSIPSPALAISSSTNTSSNSSNNNDVQTIIEAAETLNKLLSNWDKATIDCTYADIPRELLEQKNKEQLLEKASTFALFDKSTSVTSCKKTNKIVRDYIGVTGKGPLVNIEKKMLKSTVVDNINFNIVDLDEYYTQVENFQNAISRASSLSYAAGIADFDSVNNFDKGPSSPGAPAAREARSTSWRRAPWGRAQSERCIAS